MYEKEARKEIKEVRKEKERGKAKEAKEKKGFGELFGLAWRDFSDNFNLSLKLGLLLYFIPQIIYLLALYFIVGSFDVNDANITKFFNPIFLILILVLFLAGVLLSLVLVYAVLYNKKNLTLKSSIKQASKFYWKFLILSIVVGLALFGLFILFIIPGIIFMIYWLFACLILVNEKKGVIQSIKESKKIVRGKWWRAFGYWILLSLIIIGISIVIGMVTGLFNSILFNISVYAYVVVRALLGMLSTVIVSLLGIAFLKHFYFDLKETKIQK